MDELTREDFDYIRNRLYTYCRINLSDKKESLIISRLAKRLKALNIDSISEYVKHLKYFDKGDIEFGNMVDALSTNYSHFFREDIHFRFLEKKVFPRFHDKVIRIWSAAASNGQEIYSILITILEYEQSKNCSIKYKLYASDISKTVLDKASKGIYTVEDVKHISHSLLKKYFLQGQGKMAGYVRLKKDLVKKVDFLWLNLNIANEDIPLMDVIFLRNVIIYFDKESTVEIIARIVSKLNFGGYLIVGNSESLTGIHPELRHIEKSIYIKDRV